MKYIAFTPLDGLYIDTLHVTGKILRNRRIAANLDRRHSGLIVSRQNVQRECRGCSFVDAWGRACDLRRKERRLTGIFHSRLRRIFLYNQAQCIEQPASGPPFENEL